MERRNHGALQVRGIGLFIAYDLLVLPENHFAVLLSETVFADFAAQVKAHPEIDTLYIVTDSEPAFRMMTDTLPGRTAYQLYRDYLENFQINLRR